MPRDEGLAEADVFDQVRDRGFALGEPSDDPEAVHIGQRLVNQPNCAEVVRLVDDRGDRGANSGGRRAQGKLQGWRTGRSGEIRHRRINGRLYQYALILQRCQAPTGRYRTDPLDGAAKRMGVT